MKCRGLGACVATGVFLTGGIGAYTLIGSDAVGATNPQAFQPAAAMQVRSALTLQKMMDDIHNGLPSGDGKHYTGSTGPTSAWLTPSEGGFSTNCKNGSGANYDERYKYQKYAIFTYGVGYRMCDVFGRPPPSWIKESKTGEFQEKLDAIGDSLLRAVRVNGDMKLANTETAVSAYLNRKHGTVKYAVPSGANNFRPAMVEKIVLHRRYKTINGKKQAYTEAAVYVLRSAG